MRKFALFAMTVLLFNCAQASWYWPFDSAVVDERPKRISELVEPASDLIEAASDLAAEGKTNEAVEKYRKALMELDRIELENPSRAKSAEFATLRNKRAYVNAAIDSLLLGQVKSNAKAVAVSDTTELERRLAAEKAGKTEARVEKGEGEKKPDAGRKEDAEREADSGVEKDLAAEDKARVETREKTLSKQAKALTKRDQVLTAIEKGDFTTAERMIDEMLVMKPNGAAALNLRAAMEARQGRLKKAEATLDQAISSNPRNYFAYYNMAKLMLQTRSDDKSVAKRYYETGRTFGGPVDAQLEEAFK